MRQIWGKTLSGQFDNLRELIEYIEDCLEHDEDRKYEFRGEFELDEYFEEIKDRISKTAEFLREPISNGNKAQNNIGGKK